MCVWSKLSHWPECLLVVVGPRTGIIVTEWCDDHNLIWLMTTWMSGSQCFHPNGITAADIPPATCQKSGVVNHSFRYSYLRMKMRHVHRFRGITISSRFGHGAINNSFQVFPFAIRERQHRTFSCGTIKGSCAVHPDILSAGATCAGKAATCSLYPCFE
jgi:hypothetical protein